MYIYILPFYIPLHHLGFFVLFSVPFSPIAWLLQCDCCVHIIAMSAAYLHTLLRHVFIYPWPLLALLTAQASIQTSQMSQQYLPRSLSPSPAGPFSASQYCAQIKPWRQWDCSRDLTVLPRIRMISCTFVREPVSISVTAAQPFRSGLRL